MAETFHYIEQVLRDHSKTFFPATRLGPTAVGHTLETSVFKKAEDNLKTADIVDTELKGKTGKGSRRVRLGTSNCGLEQQLLESYGKLNSAQTKRQFYPLLTMGKPRTLAPATVCDLVFDDELLGLSVNGSVIGGWGMDALSEMIHHKLRKIAIVEAEKKIVEGRPHFRYTAVDFYSGLCIPSIVGAIEQGLIKVEFRINEEHDHGTSFNTTTKAMRSFYRNHERIDFTPS